MPEGENLRFELKTRANGEPKGGKQSDEQSQHAGRERCQPSAQICNGDKKYRVSGRDNSRKPTTAICGSRRKKGSPASTAWRSRSSTTIRTRPSTTTR